eukprot:6486448-Amphidinium_carterae.1
MGSVLISSLALLETSKPISAYIFSFDSSVKSCPLRLWSEGERILQAASRGKDEAHVFVPVADTPIAHLHPL